MIRVLRTVKKEVGRDCADFAVSAKTGRPATIVEHYSPVATPFESPAGMRVFLI